MKTPYYLYDLRILKDTLDVAKLSCERHGIEMHYAVKANSEKRILSMISAAGFGAECVSGNEIALAVECGFAPSVIMFDGCGKTDEEIRFALRTGIRNFNVESLEELEVIEQIAADMDCIAPVSLRINPDIDARTLKAITTGLDDNKFGIGAYCLQDAIDILGRSPHLSFKGVQFHVGSQILQIDTVFKEACIKAMAMVKRFEDAGLEVETIDLGGGLGIDYENPDLHPVPDFDGWLGAIDRYLKRKPSQHVVVEPGRALVGQCGSLIASVLYVKHTRTKQFLILDAGMNNLIRPALYGAYHKIENITAAGEGREALAAYDVVGPICESSDVFAESRQVRVARRGDLVAIRSAGAYGATMSSRYNLHDIAEAVYKE